MHIIQIQLQKLCKKRSIKRRKRRKPCLRGLVGRGKQQMMTGAAYKYKEPEALFFVPYFRFASSWVFSVWSMYWPRPQHSCRGVQEGGDCLWPDAHGDTWEDGMSRLFSRSRSWPQPRLGRLKRSSARPPEISTIPFDPLLPKWHGDCSQGDGYLPLEHAGASRQAGIDIPRIDDGRGLECCPAPPVRRLERKSYQEQEKVMDQLEQFLPYIGCSVLTLWDSRWWWKWSNSSNECWTGCSGFLSESSCWSLSLCVVPRACRTAWLTCPGSCSRT